MGREHEEQSSIQIGEPSSVEGSKIPMADKIMRSDNGQLSAAVELASQGCQDQVDGTDCLGQLVLNVDFAPPREAHESHLIEVSLGIRQTNNHNWLGCGSPKQICDSDQQKRRLVYERIDRFPLELAETRLLAGLSPHTCSPGFVLPFKSNSFDACLCFNLLNIRLASQRLLSLERSEPAKESMLEEQGSRQGSCPEWASSVEQDWLKMSRLTNELRLQILRELSRVVKSRGKL